MLYLSGLQKVDVRGPLSPGAGIPMPEPGHCAGLPLDTGGPEALSFQAAHSVIPSRARNLVQKACAINWYDASDPSLRLRV